MIREDKNEHLLIELIQDKKLAPNNTNKEGMNPLILAVDCEFNAETLRRLVELGCEVDF